ncbi:hypothetical protein JTB14_008503 [Gonioctena quinquepunctata]|nr:hypothetical protein JTB14_008503 [Gonioctena quinquepunctata]
MKTLQDLRVLKRHPQTHKQNKNSFINGNKLVVDKIEYTVSQLPDIEKGAEYREEALKPKSVPSTPIQLLLRESHEKEADRYLQESTNYTTSTPEASGSTRKQPAKLTIGQNL